MPLAATSGTQIVTRPNAHGPAMSSSIQSALIDGVMIVGMIFLILLVHDGFAWILKCSKWQFSLRALLIAVTVSSLALGMIAVVRN
jgi:hypothetical protein